MIRRSLLSGFVILGSLFASVTPLLAAENECEATITGKLMRKETSDTKTVFTGKVDVLVQKSCATVWFDLVVVEEVSGGEQTTVRVSKRVKVRDAAPTSLKMDYKVKRGHTVVSHRFEQTSCQICE